MIKKYIKLESMYMKYTGKTQRPNMKYILRKAYKYIFIVPRVAIRALFRKFIDYTPNTHLHKFVFVCGLHRSGTSVLHRLIQENDRVSGISGTTVPEDEGQFLQDIYPADNEYGILFANHSEVHIDEKSNLVNSNNKLKLLKSWGRYWDFSKDILIEKSPSNIVRTAFLQQMFTDSIFIIITRHPIVASLAVQKWTSEPLDKIVEHWFVAHEIFMKDAEKLDKYIVVRYEDLINKTDETLLAVFDLIGVEFIESKERFIDHNKKYFDKFTTEYDRKYLAHLDEKYTHILDLYGYSLTPNFVTQDK